MTCVKPIGTVSAVLATLALAASLTACHSATSDTASPAATTSPSAPPAAPATAAAPSTAHATHTAAPAQPHTVTKSFSGTGSYTGAPIHFGCNTADGPITVKYTYWNNNDGFGAANFMADLEDSQGLPVGDGIVNDIATSGGKTTHIYPGEFSTPPFHLTVEAATAGQWAFTFTCHG